MQPDNSFYVLRHGGRDYLDSEGGFTRDIREAARFSDSNAVIRFVHSHLRAAYLSGCSIVRAKEITEPTIKEIETL